MNEETKPAAGLVRPSDELGPPPALKPCPFCGAHLEMTWRRSNPRAKCGTFECWGARLPVVSLDDKDEVAAWNTRA
jgi:hypothetical protein